MQIKMEKILGMYIVQSYFRHSSRGPGKLGRGEFMGQGGHAPSPDLAMVRLVHAHNLKNIILNRISLLSLVLLHPSHSPSFDFWFSYGSVGSDEGTEKLMRLKNTRRGKELV
jgi:hypothetical protein